MSRTGGGEQTGTTRHDKKGLNYWGDGDDGIKGNMRMRDKFIHLHGSDTCLWSTSVL